MSPAETDSAPTGDATESAWGAQDQNGGPMDAFIYDAIRSPRGRGRKDGALHEVTALRLSAQMLDALAERSGLPADAVDDVIWGNVTQVAEQGGCLARAARAWLSTASASSASRE